MESEKTSFNYNIFKLILVGFALSLPLHEKVNTWFLIALALYAVFYSIKYRLKDYLKSHLLLLSIPALLLIIRLFDVFVSNDYKNNIDDLTRGLSFIFIPFSLLILQRLSSSKIFKIAFWSLTIGCFLAAVICWSSVIFQIFKNNEPITGLFTWKKSNTYLTAVIDIHPPYLGILILTVIIFLFKTYIHYNKQIKLKFIALCLISLFSFFLFHLVARNSILFLILMSFGYAVLNKKFKMLLLGSIFIMGLSYVVVNQGNHYLKRKYYKMLDLSDEKIGDKRFKRLEASWNIFTQYPFFGAGKDKISQLRLNEYKKMNDQRAIDKNFNAHNQYMEYLCTYGIIGLFVFLFVLFYLLRETLLNRHYFLTILLFLFMFSCLTESVLERELGVKYFSFIAGCIIFLTSKQKIQNNEKIGFDTI